MTPQAIRQSFEAAYKAPVCQNTQPGHPDWVEVFGIFAGNVTERMTVLADGSDLIDAVKDRQRKLERRYPDYTFAFDGFVTT